MANAKKIKVPRIIYSQRVLNLLKQEFGIGRKAVNDALTFRVISERSDAVRSSAVYNHRCRVEYDEIEINKLVK